MALADDRLLVFSSIDNEHYKWRTPLNKIPANSLLWTKLNRSGPMAMYTTNDGVPIFDCSIDVLQEIDEFCGVGVD